MFTTAISLRGQRCCWSTKGSSALIDRCRARFSSEGIDYKSGCKRGPFSTMLLTPCRCGTSRPPSGGIEARNEVRAERESTGLPAGPQSTCRGSRRCAPSGCSSRSRIVRKGTLVCSARSGWLLLDALDAGRGERRHVDEDGPVIQRQRSSACRNGVPAGIPPSIVHGS